MATQHWDDDALIRHAYGVGPQDNHLDECPECAARWRELAVRRQVVLEDAPVSEGLLAAQRRAIRNRLESPAPRRGPLALAAGAIGATALLVVAVLVQHRPDPVPTPPVSDSQLYAESYSMAVSVEPEALEVMHALFEEDLER